MEKGEGIKKLIIIALILIVIFAIVTICKIQNSTSSIEFEWTMNSYILDQMDNHDVAVINLTLNNVSGKYLDINWYDFNVYDSNNNLIGTNTLANSNSEYLFYSEINKDEYLQRSYDVNDSITGYIFIPVSSKDISRVEIVKN